MKTKLFSALLLALLPFVATASAADEHQAKPAAPATCPVSGEKIGSMGEGYVHTHKVEGQPDRTVTLCCKMCVGKFNRDPERYLAKDAKATEAPAKTDEHAGHNH